MRQLTDAGQRLVEDAGQRHGFSADAVVEMLRALADGYGTQAQFNHPEFGGMGQWSSGGMLMIGDMFNNQLKGRVASLAQELAGQVQNQPMFAMPAQSQSQSQGGGWQGQGGGGQQQSQGGGWQGQGSGWQGQGGSGQQQSQNGIIGSSLFVPGGGNNDWWPADLGPAASVGAQNAMRYAYFPAPRRLAIDVGGRVTVYDTGDHQIGGFSQQQGGDQSLLFTSQYGLVRVADLPVVSGVSGSSAAPPTSSFTNPPPQAMATAAPAPAPAEMPAAPSTAPIPAPVSPTSGPVSEAAPALPSGEILQLIEKLADLHAKGVLTGPEFEAKKAELLKRL